MLSVLKSHWLLFVVVVLAVVVIEAKTGGKIKGLIAKVPVVGPALVG